MDSRIETYAPFIADGLNAYINRRIAPGGFLRSVLENDLAGACFRADVVNRRMLPAIVEWLRDCAPHECWGSPEKVARWLAGGNEE